ncbi:uncharacterized protein LOC144084339 isoform X2 [Stigmatopora argus]
MERTCGNLPLVLTFVLAITSARVAPPYNVILHCGNLINQLTWDYDRPPAGLHFRVDVDRFYSSRKIPPLQVDLPELQANVSFLSEWMDDYNLYVTAVLGNNETSEAAPADGVSFSYDVDSSASQICSLDLPPVTVLEQEEHFLLLSFQHPWLVYQHGLPSRSRKKRNEQLDDETLPVFVYDVTLDKKEFADLRCTDEVCRHKLPVAAGPRPRCVAIKGELERIGVYGTRDYCARPAPQNRDVIIPMAVSSLLLAAVFAVLVMICWKRARPSSSELPASLRFDTGKEEMSPQPQVVPSPDDSTLQLLVETPSESEARREVDEPADDGADEEEDRDADGGEMEAVDEDVSDHRAYERRDTVERLSLDENVEGYR